MESDFFWIAAASNLLISLRFVVIVQKQKAANIKADLSKFAQGQRQDSWLASAIIWGAILFRELPYVDFIYSVGFVTLMWLTFRALTRIKLLLKA